MKIYISLLTLLILHIPVLSQETNVQVTQNPDDNNNRHKQVAIEWQTEQLDNNHLIIQLPASFESSLIEVGSGDEKYWLKKSNSSPSTENQIHWYALNDSTIILRFTPGGYTPGEQMQINLDLYSKKPFNTDWTLLLRESSIRNTGEAYSGRVLERILIPPAE
ncbi:MAG: hypothetical protein GF313_00185 [Caldithrix sp.]|nr:hypothetical protein [Caldithrix sp.]